MATTALAVAAVNEIIYANPAAAHAPYDWEPTHPALATLAWEDERTDVHAVIGGQHGIGRYAFTCAVCHAPNPATDMHGQMDVFPRCSSCAF
jgi:mono/diheme cytochrome c family protein